MPPRTIGYSQHGMNLFQLYVSVSLAAFFDNLEQNDKRLSLTSVKNIKEIEVAVNRTVEIVEGVCKNECGKLKADKRKTVSFKDAPLSSKPSKRQEKQWFESVLENPEDIRRFIKFIATIPIVDMGFRTNHDSKTYWGNRCICPFHGRFEDLWKACDMNWYREKYGCECATKEKGVFKSKDLFLEHCLGDVNNWYHRVLETFLRQLYDVKNDEEDNDNLGFGLARASSAKKKKR